jgi:cytochrome c-type biogenesis protein
MIEGVFTWLSKLIESAPLLAFWGAFLWGVLSILLSPCHLSSIPLIVGFIGQQGRIRDRRAFVISLSFSVGILVTIGLIGLITSLMGRMLGDIGDWSKYLVAGVFFLVGLYLLDIIKMHLPGISRIGMKRKGVGAAFLLGLIFGIALGPCTFAYMAPIIAVAFSTSSNDLLFGVLLLLFYGIGHCLVIVFAGTFTEMIQRYLNWTGKSKGTVILKRVCGFLVIIAGIYMLIV